MKQITEINLEWVKQSEWKGNPSLGYDCYMKQFVNPFTGKKIPVYLFGLPESKELNFCVSGGANSDYSHSGCFYPEKLTWEESMKRIDEKYKARELIY